MEVTFNKQTALAVMRLARARAGKQGIRRRATRMHGPDPTPRASWTKSAFSECLTRAGLNPAYVEKVHVCVPDSSHRLRSRFVSSTVYAKGLPRDAFWQLENGTVLSSPELLFVELANDLSFAEHLLLGFELTGTYSLSPHPSNGGAAELGVPAVTSVKRIGAFLDASRHLNGSACARRTLALLADDAWSPFEAILATMMALPWEAYGYGFGRCVLNLRVETPSHLVGSAQKTSRVPDILVEGTHVGVNYDGGEHLNLGSIADAGIALGQNLGDGRVAAALDRAIERVRRKYVDDGRRTRELFASGYVVFPLFKEDLYQFGGLDRAMMQLLEALGRTEGREVAQAQKILQGEFARKERQALLDSLLPGREPAFESDVHEAFVRLPNRKRRS